jgi:mannose-1-phosphate guanylyltransferase
MSNLYAVILAGGSGTRFWPASRKARPKQVLAIGPDSELPLIARTARRIEPLCGAERTFIATGTALIDVTKQALPWLSADAFFAEPVARNTAPCIGWAASLIHRRDPDALVCVLPSDHHIRDEAGFLAAVQRAANVAEKGTIATMGIRPTRPETGYGYIEAGAELAPGVRSVSRFVEKPNVERAQEYVASNNYFWNSGMFFFKARTMLDAIAAHMPELSQGLARIEESAKRGANAEREETAKVFDTLSAISIDYGIMEKVRDLAVIPADFGWSDLGSWQSVWELSKQDAVGNAGPETAIFVDAKNNLVDNLQTGSGKKRVIALLGVNDLCVVDTDDALLVIPKDRAQDVREIVEALKRRGGPV